MTVSVVLIVVVFRASSIISESEEEDWVGWLVGGYLCIKLNFTELSLNRSQ